MRRALVAMSLALAVLMATPADAQDSERLRNAKALVFDRKYDDARAAWQQILAAGGPDAEAAAYWIARCSEGLKDDPRALKEYGDFLARKPADRALVDEAKTSRIGIAARLFKSGDKSQLALLKDSLDDASKTVRYYAAFQVAGLGVPVAASAAPVLKRIVADESDPDLVDRARLLLLRVDPQALTPAPAPAPNPRPNPRPVHEATWLRVRIYEHGKAAPSVSVNVPLALAELALKAIPDDARKDLERKGYEPGNILERLRRLGPTEIVTVEGDDGEKVQIWIE